MFDNGGLFPLSETEQEALRIIPVPGPGHFHSLLHSIIWEDHHVV